MERLFKVCKGAIRTHGVDWDATEPREHHLTAAAATSFLNETIPVLSRSCRPAISANFSLCANDPGVLVASLVLSCPVLHCQSVLSSSHLSESPFLNIYSTHPHNHSARFPIVRIVNVLILVCSRHCDHYYSSSHPLSQRFSFSC